MRKYCPDCGALIPDDTHADWCFCKQYQERAEAAQAEIETLRIKLDFEMAHSQRMMEERDRANQGFAALKREYDKAMTRLAAHGEKVTA